MTDKVMVSRLTAYFNRLPEERRSEILGMAEAFTLAQQGTAGDRSRIHGVLREPGSRDLGKGRGREGGQRT